MRQDDIAKALGVSKTTVSRALSGKGRIGEETKLKIEEYVNRIRIEEGSVNQSKNLCVALPSDSMISTNPFFSECLYGVCEAVSSYDYNVIVVKSMDNDISEIRKVVEEKKADGIILTRSLVDDKALEYLSASGFPTAVAGHCDYDNVIRVDIDNERAVEELTGLLIGKGYRRFAVVVDDLNHKVNNSRLSGFKKALDNKGIDIEKQYIHTGRFMPDTLEVISSRVLSNKAECILCGDDEIAVKVMSWLKNEGYRIPGDVAIASCYNSRILNAVVPAITAIDSPARVVGSALGKQLICKIENRQYDTMTNVDYEILIRKSTSGKQ